MSIWEYDAELHEEVIREESEAKGEARGTVDDKLRDIITSEKDTDILNRWFTTALKCPTIKVFKQMM